MTAPIRWRPTTITLSFPTGEHLVRASVCQGLAVHRYTEAGLFGEVSATADAWTVTHVASGKAIAPNPLPKRRAYDYARALLAVGEWTRVQVGDLREAVERVRGVVFSEAEDQLRARG